MPLDHIIKLAGAEVYQHVSLQFPSVNVFALRVCFVEASNRSFAVIPILKTYSVPLATSL